MEKKLTDEEIVKALVHCSNNRSCEYCYHNDEVGSGEIVCRARLMIKAIDLIHRLQSEKTEQKEIIEKQVKIYDKLEEAYGNLVQENAEQKEEIERLTEEKGKYQEKWQTSYMNELNLHKQVDELENRFENKAHCNMSENCSMVQQAVKGTAKEILDKAIKIDRITGSKGFVCIEALKELCKNKGVEVE